MYKGAYAAGLFDGEGSIYTSSIKVSASIAVKITNTDVRLCLFIKERWGGHLQVISSTGKNVKTLYRWYAYGKNALPFLRAIDKFSIGKKELVQLALEGAELKRWDKASLPRLTSILNQIREINTQGHKPRSK